MFLGGCIFFHLFLHDAHNAFWCTYWHIFHYGQLFLNVCLPLVMGRSCTFKCSSWGREQLIDQIFIRYNVNNAITDLVIFYNGMVYGMVWYGMVWYGMVWYGMVWYGMVWYGMAIYDVVCCGIDLCVVMD